MAEVKVTGEIDAPADAVWAIIRDFGSVGWMQGVARVELEGEGPGMVRKIFTPGASEPVVEELEFVEEDAKRLGYAIPRNNPMPADDYHATCTVTAAGQGRSRLEWACTFRPRGGDEGAAKTTIEAMYGVLIGWVRGAAEQSG